MERKQIEVNYLYYGIFLALLLLTSASGIFIKESLAGSRTFFFLYAAGQSIFETLLLVFLGWVISRFLGATAFMAFIGLTFIFLILHLFDFIVDRVLDLSVWETIRFVSNESWGNFLYLLDASGIPLWVWGLGLAVLIALPFLGMLLYAWTRRLALQRPLHLRREWFFQSFLCIPAALIFWEFSASPILHPDSYTAFLKSIPWKWTFLEPRNIRYPIPAALIQPREEKEIQAEIARDATVLPQKPNIYFFIIESFREDFVTPQIAPHLSRFKQGASHFDLALSNANGSHPSWFSIFHSQFSYFWRHLQTRGWEMGSPPINLLKKWGYQVRVYSSAQLKYYGMDELLFGKGLHLVDSYQAFHHLPPLSAADTDAETIAKWKEDLSLNPDLKEGQLVIFFWDSTHFNYSWPNKWPLKFLPISKEIDYFTVFQSTTKIEKIKNRYRNAIHYLDSLFGEIIKDLPDPENAVVIVSGDHGEEFFEHGHLFHGSHIIHEQTNIPLYMKFGTHRNAPEKGQNRPRIVSQMDIFPSLIHHLSGKQTAFLEGRSIFSKDHWPYAVISRFNAGSSPYEFCLHNGEHKLIARFDNKKDPFQSKSIALRSLWNFHDQCVFDNKKEIGDWVQIEFGSAIERLFSRPKE